MGNQRLVGIVGVVVVAAVAIAIAVASGGDDENGTTTATTTAATTGTGTTETGTTDTETETTETEQEPAEPEIPVVEIENGKPVDGVQRLEFKRDETIRFEVTSEDTGGEIHFHGYDISRDLEPGRTVRFRTKADAEGIFEVEIEETHTQIAQVRVEP